MNCMQDFMSITRKGVILFGICLIQFLASSTHVQAATTTAEWSYVRGSSDLDTGSEVHLRQPYESEDLLKVFLARNGKLYEDEKWKINKLTKKVEDINFGKANKVQNEEQKIWDLFLKIAGQDFVKKNVAYYVSYREQNNPVLGAVWRTRANKEPTWVVGINTNAADFENEKWKRDISITLIHELGHILTLNKTQIKYVKSRKSCQKIYWSIMGCPYKEAYYTKFVDTFWDTDDRAHNASTSAETTGKDAAKRVRNYYKAHLTEFVVQYAATSPEEDLAESFVDFVLQAKPTNATLEKNRKILFFYQYPEFVLLRAQIRPVVEGYFK